jgi:hypothetical protein
MEETRRGEQVKLAIRVRIHCRRMNQCFICASRSFA